MEGRHFDVEEGAMFEGDAYTDEVEDVTEE